jgi:far upstream element-binding protein
VRGARRTPTLTLCAACLATHAAVPRKRQAEDSPPAEDTPTAKRGVFSPGAPEDDPPAAGEGGGDDPPAAGGEEAPAAADPASSEPPTEAAEAGEPAAPPAPPAAHDPAYAAAAFPEPVGGGAVGYHMPPFNPSENAYVFQIDPVLVGRIIGKGGETIRQLQGASGAHIDIDQNFPEGQPRKVRTLRTRDARAQGFHTHVHARATR